MALQSYATLKVFYDGEALTQVTSIKHSINGGKNRVDLIETGLSGFSPGAGECTIDIGYAILKDGAERDFKSDAALLVYRTLQIQEGDRYYIGQGTVMTADSSQSAGAHTEGTFSWTGELKPMEG